MLKKFLKEVEKESTFTVAIFDEQIQVSGRLLSPSEAEAASLNSTLLISQVTQSEGKGLGDLRDLSKDLNVEDPSEEAIDRAYNFLKKLKPQQLEQIAQHQNKIICQVVKKASMDGGESWERMQVVMNQEEQNADHNRLWVGMLSSSDRTRILNKAMAGHAEAVERLSTFLK